MSQMPALARSDAASAPARGPRRPAAPVRGSGRGSARGSSRSHLRVVTAAPRPPRRMPFVVLCSVVLAAGLLAVLFLNLQLAKGTYALHDLQRRSTLLAEQNEALTQQLAALQAPGVLAQRATELGMVPGSSPAFLRLPDGQVLGVPQAAATAPPPESAKDEEGEEGEEDLAGAGSADGRHPATSSGRADADSGVQATASPTSRSTRGASAHRETPSRSSPASRSTSGTPNTAARAGTPTGQATR